MTHKRIPISAGRKIADDYGYDQVVIIARKVGGGGGEHVTTYGKDKTHCTIAARMGDFFKYHLMRWPSSIFDMSTAPRDGTHFLAYLYHEPADGSDFGPDHPYPGFGEWREIFFKAGGDMGTCWHAGDPYDSHSGNEAPEHFGEAVPIAWLPLPGKPANAKAHP